MTLCTLKESSADAFVDRLILYDSAGKSGGICHKAFDHVSMLLQQAADTIANCRCLEGCPSCAFACHSCALFNAELPPLPGVASQLCSGANTSQSFASIAPSPSLTSPLIVVSKLGALVVLDSILGRPIDIDAIPMQEPPKGVTPGGTIDLAAAGVRPRAMEGARRDKEMRGVMEEEEMEEAERVEREAALAELLGGGPVTAGGGKGATVFDLNETGGFLQAR